VARTLTVLILAVIVAVSVGPLPVPDLPGLWAGLPHAIAYAALTGCLLVAWKPRHIRASWVAAAALAVVALGAVMEAAQALVGRDVELVDFGADVIGVVTVIFVWMAERKRRAVSARDAISRP
jgi:VanZ family protein